MRNLVGLLTSSFLVRILRPTSRTIEPMETLLPRRLILPQVFPMVSPVVDIIYVKEATTFVFSDLKLFYPQVTSSI